ncbi:MAG: DegT/DnrJ/EryC1/StrS family aminotransferase [Actinomycetota bacterium]
MVDNLLPVMRPLLPTAASLAPYLARIDDARVYTNWGPLSEALRGRLGEHFGVGPEQVALLANGTLALQGAIETMGDPMSVVGIPSWTFIATGLAVDGARRAVHLVDVDPGTWARVAEPRTRFDGDIVVAPFGDRPDVEAWAASPTPVIFDAASCFDACEGIGPALGARCALMVSLHATKPLAAGEGGALVGPEDWIAEIVRWANFGIAEDRVVRRAATNAKLSEYHAAVGLTALDQWERTRSQWQEVNAWAVEVADGLGMGVQPALRKGFVTTTWVAEFADDATKPRVLQHLADAGIDSRDWWSAGVGATPYFATAPRDDLSVTERLARRTLGLPMARDMTRDAFGRVADALNGVCAG